MDEGQRLDDENTCSSSTRRLGFHSFTADILDDATENKSSAGLFLNCYNQRRSLYRFGKHIHSLLLSSTQKSETRLAQDKLATIPNSFPLLRVLNIESINCDLLPNEVYGLYLLKYLAITSNLNLLPESFKNLRELETLVIKTTTRTLQIEGGIWNMEKLRHVRTNTSAQLPFPPKTNNCRGKNIRTLSTISPTSCRKEIFSRIPNLQKLGVRGNLSQLLEEQKSICLLNNLGMLKCLENLKLYGQYDKVLTVPVLDKFACKLKKLSFSGTLFEWKDMAVLGKLEELEVLKLDDYAFKGENWELSNDVVFRRLQYLRIGRTNLVTWKLVTHNSFPALQGLVLQNCSSLERIPENFAKVHTLKVMELFHMSENAVKSAKEMKENVDRRIKLVITSGKREGPMTAAMDMVIEQEVSEAVDRLVQTVAAYTKNNYVKQSRGSPRFVLDSEIQDLTSDIETFSARLVEAYKNPFACVDVLIVKNFQTVVNKAEDAVANYIALKKKIYEHEALRSFPLPSNMVKLKSCESEIQSVKTQVDMICQEHENYLQSLNQYKTGVLLSLQREGLTVFDKVIEDVKVVVNKLVQIVEESSCYLESVHAAEIKDMTSHILTFIEKLVEACKNPNANEHRVLRVVVKKFRMLVNEAQDAVAHYFALEKKHRGKHLLQKQLDNFAFFTKVDVYAGKIQSINAKMKRIGKDHDKDLLYLLDYKQIDLQPPKAGPVIHENKSLKNDLETIKGSLMEASNNLIVIAIVGMGGTGKTTFASMLFQDPEILQKFTHCIWVHVSQCFDRKQKFIDILQQILRRAEDFSMDSGDVIDDEGQKLDDENTSSTRRRLCFHSSTMDILLGAEKNPSRLYLSSYNKRRRRSPFGKQVHSLSAFSSEWGEIIDVTQEQLATISNTFALLKVLNIEQQLIRSSLLPNDIYGLYLLRYLAITANNLNFLPKSFKNLGELETLVINTTEPRLQIDGGIWNMEKLRHVHTNTPMQLPSPPKNSSGGTSIRTLCTISPSSCTKEIFRKIPRLQKLGVRGNLSELGLLQQQDQKVCLFNNLLQMLYWLENLKLHGNSEKVALKVPMLDMFASKLRKLTLCGTLFQWNDMTILGSLEMLEVLKLDDNAFFGELWDLSPDVTFKRLKYLRIGRTNLIRWTAEDESFPALESLVLRNCISLQNIPYAFAALLSLKVMELFHVHEIAANCAKLIREEILEYGGEVYLRITPLPPQATVVHEQEYGEENVNTIGSDIPSTSNPKQEIICGGSSPFSTFNLFPRLRYVHLEVGIVFKLIKASFVAVFFSSLDRRCWVCL
nr:putative late blight resistance protein homolog R1B-8 [Ipomoea batatas]